MENDPCMYVGSCFEKAFRQQLIKHVAGEARGPSRKMRLEKCCIRLPDLFILEFDGAGYGKFYWNHFRSTKGPLQTAYYLRISTEELLLRDCD